jgi:hypothetical protein
MLINNRYALCALRYARAKCTQLAYLGYQNNGPAHPFTIQLHG